MPDQEAIGLQGQHLSLQLEILAACSLHFENMEKQSQKWSIRDAGVSATV